VVAVAPLSTSLFAVFLSSREYAAEVVRRGFHLARNRRGDRSEIREKMVQVKERGAMGAQLLRLEAAEAMAIKRLSPFSTISVPC
jgi:hypothetical protein